MIMDFDPRPINTNDARVVGTAPRSDFEKEMKDALLNIFGNTGGPIQFTPNWNRNGNGNGEQRAHAGAQDSSSTSTGTLGQYQYQWNDPMQEQASLPQSSMLPQTVTDWSSSTAPSSTAPSSSSSSLGAPTSATSSTSTGNLTQYQYQYQWNDPMRAQALSSSSLSPAAQTWASNGESGLQTKRPASANVSMHALAPFMKKKKQPAGLSSGITGNAFSHQSSPRHSPQPLSSKNYDQAVTNSSLLASFHNGTVSPPLRDGDDDQTRNAATAESPVSSGGFQASKWDAHYQELVEYSELYGNCCVPNNWEQNSSLAQWVKRQRHQYRQQKEGHHSTLSAERQAALDRIGFVWDLHDVVWEERLNELEAFRARHGHCKIPTTYPPNPGLAIWAKCQRRHFKMFCAQKASGQVWNSNTMTDERILKLAKVGFVFCNRSSKGALEILTNSDDSEGS